MIRLSFQNQAAKHCGLAISGPVVPANTNADVQNCNVQIFKVNLDITRCTEYKVNKGKLYGLKAYSKALKRFVSLAVWYPMDVLDFYRTRFQLEFCFRDAKQHAGITNCQSTDF